MENNNSLETEFAQYSHLNNLVKELEEKMFTFGDVQSGILIAVNGLNLLDRAKKLMDNVNDLEMKGIITELQHNVVNHKSLLIDVEIELNNLKQENDALKKELERIKSPEWQLNFNAEHQVYYQKDDIKLTTTLCPNCWDNGRKKIILNVIQRKSLFDIGHSCSVCRYETRKII